LAPKWTTPLSKLRLKRNSRSNEPRLNKIIVSQLKKLTATLKSARKSSSLRTNAKLRKRKTSGSNTKSTRRKRFVLKPKMLLTQSSRLSRTNLNLMKRRRSAKFRSRQTKGSETMKETLSRSLKVKSAHW